MQDIQVMDKLKMNSDELRWQSEADAETMARYEEILSDPKRRKRAADAAKKKAEELQKRAAALKSASTRK